MNQIHTAQSMNKSLNLDCDVCVIGSGAGGGMLAAGLAKRGLNVIMLEAGPYRQRSDFNMDESVAFSTLYQNRGLQATDDTSISLLQGSNVGGGTTINWTSCFRTPSRVLEAWGERFGLTSLTPDTLSPHFDAVESMLNVKEWPFALVNENNKVLLRGAKELGWGISPIRRNVVGCLDSGYCGMGCPINAKQGMLLTAIPEALNAGMRLYADTIADKIVVKNDRVVSVNAVVRDPNTGRPGPFQLTIHPKIVVSSCGALHGPALFLRSGINDNGLVGKRTFIHPVVGVGAEFEQPINGFYGAPQSVSSHEFIDRGPDKYGFFMEAAPTHPILSATAATHFGVNAQDFMSKLSRMAFIIALHHDGMLIDDRGGEVTLRKDGSPSLRYVINDQLKAAFAFSHVKMTEVALAAGSSGVYSLHLKPVHCTTTADLSQYSKREYGAHCHGIFSAHQMGGLTMGSDPLNSVINPDFRHHRIGNLFAVDGSVFPTALGVNPSLTIYALANRARDLVSAAL